MRVDNTAAASQSLQGQDDPGADAGVQAGNWRGQVVQVTNDDIVGNAAEEISMEHSEHVESTKLEEREVEDKPEVDVPLVEQIQEYLESASKADLEDKLRQFVETLLEHAHGRGGSGDSGDSGHAGAREEARRRFDGPTEQFLALSYAAGKIEKMPGREALVEEVRGALQDLHDDYAGHIRADLNTIDVAAAFGHGDADEIERFQSGYRDAVLGDGSLAGLLSSTLERFGADDYGRAVSSMIQALGNDLGAIQGPSAPPARLNAVLQELYQLEVLATALDGCRKLAGRLKEAHGVELDAGAVLTDLVGAAGERWGAGSRFTSIAERHGATDTQARILFLDNAKSIVRNLPPKVFPDADARFSAVGAVQEALDTAIALEDEE